MAPPGASSPPPPAAAPALNASGACRQLRDTHRSQPSLLDGPLGRLLKDDPSPSPFKDGLHRTLTDLSPKTVQKYVDNLWALGGEIIRDLNETPSLRKKGMQ